MKGYKRHVSIKLLVLLLLVSLCCIFVACKDKDKTTSSTDEQTSTEITINYTENKISITSSFYLEVSSGSQKLEGVSYASSAPTVVSVAADGKVTGEKLGSATITATLGDLEKTCVVTVEAGEILPVLVLENATGDSTVQIEESASLDLSGHVTLGQNAYYDGKLSYTLSNPAAGEVVDGIFIPNPLANGVNELETTVTVTAKWRGIESGLLEKQVAIKIIRYGESFTYITVNGATYVDALTLYTTDSFEGKSYQTEFPFEYGVVENGKALQDFSALSVSVKSGAGVVEAELGTIRSLAGGEAVVQLAYESASGAKATLDIDVNVIYPVEKHSAIVQNVSAMDGFEVSAEIMSPNSVIKAVQNLGEEDEKTLDVVNGRIYGLETSSTGLTETYVTFYNAEYAYTAKVTGYERIIMTAAQLEEMLYWYGEKADYRQETYDSGTFKQRYYVLGSDIELVNTNWWARFYDVLDGQGHSITATGKISACGLFGIINVGAVVKNVGFNFLGTMEGTAVARQTQMATLAMYLKGTLENVYVNVDWVETQERALNVIAGYIYNDAIIKDVYLRITETTVIPATATADGFGYGYLSQLCQAKAVLENVQVVTSTVDKAVSAVSSEGSSYYAENETGQESVLEGVNKYTTVAQMTEAGVSKVGSWSVNADGTATYTP